MKLKNNWVVIFMALLSFSSISDAQTRLVKYNETAAFNILNDVTKDNIYGFKLKGEVGKKYEIEILDLYYLKDSSYIHNAYLSKDRNVELKKNILPQNGAMHFKVHIPKSIKKGRFTTQLSLKEMNDNTKPKQIYNLIFDFVDYGDIKVYVPEKLNKIKNYSGSVMMPDYTNTNAYTVLLSNSGESDVIVSMDSLVLKSTTTGEMLHGNNLIATKMQSPISLRAKSLRNLHLEIKESLDLNPGQYTLMSKVTIGDKDITVNDLSVFLKNPPLIALVAMILGVLLGLVINYYGKVEKQNQLLNELHELRDSISLVKDEVKKAEYIERWNSLVSFVRLNSNEDSLSKIETQIDKLRTDVFGIRPAGLRQKRNAPYSRLNNLLGLNITRVHMYNFVRPIVYVLLIILASLYVFKALYIDKSVFGVDGIYDYLLLFLSGSALVVGLKNFLFSNWLSTLLKVIGVKLPVN